MATIARALPIALCAVASCVRAQSTPTQSTHLSILSADNDASAAREAPVSDAPASDASVSEACDATAHPPLADYSEIREGAPFSLRVRRDPSGAWVPAEPLRMPMHHASTIVFVPALDTLVAEADRAAVILVLAVGLGRRSIEHDPRRNTWFATYAARVDRACPAR